MPSDSTVNQFLDWAIHEKDYLARLPADEDELEGWDPDTILDLIPEYLEPFDYNLSLLAAAARDLSDAIREARTEAIPPGHPGFPELMRRAALGQEKGSDA